MSYLPSISPMLFFIAFSFAPLMSDSIPDFNTLNQELFHNLYESPLWNYTDPQTGKKVYSGPETTREQHDKLCRELPPLLKNFNIKIILDAPCGDLPWIRSLDMSHLDLYIGVDIVESLIIKLITEFTFGKTPSAKHIFKVKDIPTDALDYTDAIICRGYFPHVDFHTIWLTLRNFKKSGAEYLILSTYRHQTINHDFNSQDLIVPLCYRPLNFQLPPFNFPEPLFIIHEDSPESEHRITDKSLGIWRIDSLSIPD